VIFKELLNQKMLANS